jgi:CAAX protease family protein
MFSEFTPFIILFFTILSTWITKIPLISKILLVICIILALLNNVINLISLIFIITLIALWAVYKQKSKNKLKLYLFFTIIGYSFLFLLHLIPNINNIQITENFFLNFDKILIGILPLIFLALPSNKWKLVFTKGLLISLTGITVMLFLALISKTVRFEFKFPTHLYLRYFGNLFFVSIPEEAFFRGFIQKHLSIFLKKIPKSNYIALLITALIFTLGHLYWSPNIGIFAFVFLAGILYGFVYLKTNLESAILCHFLLNFIHMTFFNYHAM